MLVLISPSRLVKHLEEHKCFSKLDLGVLLSLILLRLLYVYYVSSQMNDIKFTQADFMLSVIDYLLYFTSCFLFFFIRRDKGDFLRELLYITFGGMFYRILTMTVIILVVYYVLDIREISTGFDFAISLASWTVFFYYLLHTSNKLNHCSKSKAVAND